MDPLSTIVVVGGIFLVIYFIPSIIALRNDHTNRIWIFLLNLLFGWTILVWVALFIWAFNDYPITIKPFTLPRPEIAARSNGPPAELGQNVWYFFRQRPGTRTIPSPGRAPAIDAHISS